MMMPTAVGAVPVRILGMRVGRATTPWSATLEPGSCHILWGPSGGGKSTVLHTLAGTLAPAMAVDGQIRFGDGAPRSLAETAHVPGALQRHVAWLPQAPMGLLRGPVWNAARWVRDLGVSHDCLRTLDLSPDLLARPVTTWSGGEQQRLVLAATLAQTPSPSVWLLDEPSAALDAARTARVAELIAAARTAGVAMVVATHDPHLTALLEPTHWWAVSSAGVVARSAPPMHIEAAAGAETMAASAPATETARGIKSQEPAAQHRHGLSAGQIPASTYWASVGSQAITVAPRELVVLHGPSGCGKSTWARRLVGRPTGGAPQGVRGGSSVGWLQQDVRAVFSPRWPQSRVAREILVSCGPEAAQTYTSIVERLGITYAPDRLLGTHSVGELQRVALARLIATHPRGGVADEPTASLDAATSALAIDALREWAASGAAVCVATHDVRLTQVATRVVSLSAG